MSATPARHVPVLSDELLAALDPQPGQVIVDGTLGGGGHARLLAERVGPTGRVIALDLDAGMIEAARPRLEGLPVTFVHAGFDQTADVLARDGVAHVDAVLADLGISSDQLDDPSRGLTFQQDGPLDMRLDPSRGWPASRMVAELSERDLADVIYRYGEERHSRRVARRIVQAREERRIETTAELAAIVRRAVPRGRERIDPATRTFQALRIAVNEEIDALDALLRQLPAVLKLGGKAAIISFHSLEDRPVKRAFANAAVWRRITRKPVTASDDETHRNPRSRSAKLRVAERIA